jgi:hypothetical protein
VATPLWAGRRRGHAVKRDESHESLTEEPVGRGRITVTRRGDVTVFAVPPAGYRLVDLFITAFGGLFLLASLVHVWYFIGFAIEPAQTRMGFAALGWFVCIQSFAWFNGLGLIALALFYTSRRATFIVRAGGLRIVEENVLRERVHEWARGKIVSVAAVGATLKVEAAEGEGFTWAGVPRQVSEAEMAWLASELREALGLASRGRQPPEERIRQQPPWAGGHP